MSPTRIKPGDLRALLLVLAVLAVAGILMTAFLTSPTRADYTYLGAGVGILLFLVCFANSEIGLMLCAAAFLLSPEVGPKASWTGAEVQRAAVIRVEDMLILVIGFSWFVKTGRHKNLGLVVRTPLNRAILCYILVCALATVLGVSAGRVRVKTGFFYVLKYLQYYVFFFLVANHVREERQVRRFLMAMLVTCAVVSVYGILQIPGGGRVSAPFEGEVGEPNTLGGYLVFMLALVVGLLLNVRKRSHRVWLAGLVCLILPPLVYTQSRASYLAVLPVGATFILLTRGRKRMYLIAAALALLLAAPLVAPGVVKARLKATFEQPAEKGQIVVGGRRLDTSTSARVQSWQRGLKAWIERPILGAGVTGTFFLDAQYVRVLCETGLVGFVVFCWLLVVHFRVARNVYREVKTDLHRGIAMGYLAGLIGLLVHAIGANSFIIIRIMEPFYFMTGLVFMLPEVELGGAPAEAAPEPAAEAEAPRLAPAAGGASAGLVPQPER